AVLQGFGGDCVGDFRRNHGDADFVTVQQVARMDLHAVDSDRRANVVDARATVRHHQAAAEIVEPTQGGDLPNVAQTAVGHQPYGADPLHGRRHHLTRVARQVNP